jgi:hypothetical protein|tara:strand:+ start:51 stop:497 length:447 start_codon:yes stop_codon:yes gene_type:complete
MTEQATAQKKGPQVSLASLLTPSKTVTLDFPGIDGFQVALTHLSREELLKVRNKCVQNKFNKKSRAFEEQLDEDKFLTKYVEAVIQGWSGLTYGRLQELLLVDVSAQSPDEELPYSRENAEVLMKNSPDFDTWVTEAVGDLENFTESK